MNYQKIYDQLIKKRQINSLSKKYCYCEEHHIIPLSEDGPDTKDNKINLTAREHYIAHLLLAKIYDDIKMYSAINYMQTGGIKNRNFKYNNRLYGKMKEEYGKKQKGKKLSEETKEKMKGRIPWNKGKKTGQITWIYGKHHSEETRRKISKANKGKMAGSKNPMFGKDWRVGKTKDELVYRSVKISKAISKPVFQFTKDGKFIKEYESASEAVKDLKISISGISMCCLGKRKSAGGFVWKYKN